jgi:hypothetical protein
MLPARRARRVLFRPGLPDAAASDSLQGEKTQEIRVPAQQPRTERRWMSCLTESHTTKIAHNFERTDTVQLASGY